MPHTLVSFLGKARIDALDRFDQNGDSAVFAPLLETDGVPADKARSLERAAYNVRNGLAHGNPASIDYYNAIIANPGRLPAELERAMNLLLNARPA